MSERLKLTANFEKSKKPCLAAKIKNIMKSVTVFTAMTLGTCVAMDETRSCVFGDVIEQRGEQDSITVEEQYNTILDHLKHRQHVLVIDRLITISLSSLVALLTMRSYQGWKKKRYEIPTNLCLHHIPANKEGGTKLIVTDIQSPPSLNVILENELPRSKLTRYRCTL